MKKAIVLWNREKNNNYSLSEKSLDGFVLFVQENIDSVVKISIYLEGLEDGEYGFHIHEKGINSCENKENVKDCCDSLGGHFNVGVKWSPLEPRGTKHGEHTGHLCFNIIFEDSICSFDFTDDKISLYNEKENCVLGKSLVIHQDRDDMGLVRYPEEDFKKNINRFITGNAGERIACGEILKYPSDKIEI